MKNETPPGGEKSGNRRFFPPSRTRRADVVLRDPSFTTGRSFLPRVVAPRAPNLDARVRLPDVVATAFAEAAGEGGLSGVVAAGLLLRFGEPATLDSVRAGADPVGEILKAWWNDVDTDERAGACDLVAARCERLHVAIDDLDDELDPDDATWWNTLEALLLERDELASAQCVLEHFSLDVYYLLEALDAKMVAWLRSLPFHIQLQDLLLRLVAERGEGWWVCQPRQED